MPPTDDKAIAAPRQESIEEKRARYRGYVRRAEEGAAQARADCLAWFENMVGPATFATLRDDRVAAEQALTDASPNVRRCALYLLMQHHRLASEFASRCEALAWGDPDEGVRATAICALTSHFYGSKDSRLGAVLARIVRSEQEPETTRFGAYLGLIRLRGLSTVWSPHVARLHFPEDVNWAFVDSFLAGGPV